MFVASNSFAQSQKVGRLSDGRAYRVDESGMRLIDQVAELEVTTDDLKRQVVVLEDELTEKNKTIESLRAGVKVPSDHKLREQDLLGKTASGLPKAVVVASNPATSNCNEAELQTLRSKLQQSAGNDSNCNKQLAEEKSKLESLTEENSKNRDRLALLNAEKNQLASQLNASKTPDSERSNLISKLAKLEQERAALAEENEKLKDNLTGINSEKQSLARNMQQQEDGKSAEHEKLQTELASVKDQLFESQKEISKLKEQAPIVATRSRMVEAQQSQESPVAVVSPEAKNLVALIQSKIMKRKSLLDNVSKSGKGIAISASNLITSNGLSLDRLRQAVNSGSADATVVKGLNEINSILDTDISTASRIGTR